MAQKNEGRELLAQAGRAVSVGWDDLEPGEALETYTWFHVAPGLGLDVVVLSSEPVIYRGHYMAGAVQPCTVPRCVRCQNGVGTQVRCVLSVYSLDLGARGFLEVGKRTAAQIQALAGATGLLRGLGVHFSKSPDTERGHIQAAPYTGPLEVIELLAEQDPLVVLNAQWAKQALRHNRKEGSGNVQRRGEAAPASSTPSSGEAVPSPPQSIAEARQWLLGKQGQKP